MKPRRPNENKTACAEIHYSENGQTHQWRVGCMAWEKPRDLRAHLKRWRPRAKFLSVKIIPDRSKKNREPATASA